VVAEFATGVALGIDFGSSNTAAAFRDRHGFVQELRLSTAGSLMPSAVFYDGSRFLVGRTALQAAFTSWRTRVCSRACIGCMNCRRWN
jgi:molecular chaperone DnaK (HSP70)